MAYGQQRTQSTSTEFINHVWTHIRMLQQVTIGMTRVQPRDENLVSRAPAKLIACEIEKYSGVSKVHLDFSAIREIGQGFADQLFRVFASNHPHIDLQPINCNQAILSMIGRAMRTTR